MINEQFLFLGMIFLAAFMLFSGIAINSTNRRSTKHIQRRMKAVISKDASVEVISLLKERRNVTPWLSYISNLIENSGQSITTQKFITITVLLASAGGIGSWYFTRNIALTLVLSAIAGSYPFIKLKRAFNKKIADFESQLPDAIDIIVRSLRVGCPFNETLDIVSEEMKAPISKEFKTTFLDINYGTDIKVAFWSLMKRIPSTALLNLTTAVIIQKESGGNLAEVLEKISSLVRASFRFKRKVKTLSAEGRMSAWVLGSVPFVLAGLLMVITPDYIPTLTKSAVGYKIIGGSFVMMSLGIFWINQLLKSVIQI